MKVRIDAAGRIVVPKPVREQLGFSPGSELDLEVVDNRLEVSMPSRVWLEEGPYGLRAVTGDPDARLTDEDVRELLERGRR